MAFNAYMKLIVFTFLILFSSLSLAQLDDATWSDEQRLDGSIVKTLVKDRNHFYAVTVAKTPANVIHVYHYENSQLVNDNVISGTIKNSIFSFEDIFVLNGQLYLFMSSQQSNGNHLYAQKISESCLPLGEPILLTSQTLKTAFNSKELNYYIHVSPDEQYLSVSYLFDNQNVLKHPKFSSTLFNGELVQLEDHLFEVDYYLSELQLGDMRLTNEGSLLLLIQGMKRPSAIKNSFNSLDFYALLPSGEIHREQLEKENYSFFNPTIHSEVDSIYYLAYQYNQLSEKKKIQSGAKGLMVYRYAPKNSVLSEGFDLEFDKKYLLSTLDAKAQKQYDKAQRKGKEYNLALFNFRLRDVFQMQDKSYIITMEENWTTRRSVQDGRMYTSYFLYNFNNLLIMKYDSLLVRDYAVVIPKSQITQDDQGVYSSFISIDKPNNQLQFLFNDNLKNYVESGDYIGGERPYNMVYNMRNSGLARVDFDLTTGTYQRTLTSQGDMNSFLIPQLATKSEIYRTGLLTFGNRNTFWFVRFF